MIFVPAVCRKGSGGKCSRRREGDNDANFVIALMPQYEWDNVRSSFTRLLYGQHPVGRSGIGKNWFFQGPARSDLFSPAKSKEGDADKSFDVVIIVGGTKALSLGIICRDLQAGILNGMKWGRDVEESLLLRI